jgi:hypothetical protein
MAFSESASRVCPKWYAVGRGHASLLTDLDNRHSKPSRGIGHPLIHSPANCFDRYCKFSYFDAAPGLRGPAGLGDVEQIHNIGAVLTP